MKIGLIIYGSLDTLSGGYLYDRRLVEYLRSQGDTVEVISLPCRDYAVNLFDGFSFHLPSGYDILIQDELNHPSLVIPNMRPHPCPMISLVHHLRCSESRPGWHNGIYRFIERKYLQGVDGFIFNSHATRKVVNDLIRFTKPELVAHPPTDRFGQAMSTEEIKKRSIQNPLRIIFLGNVIERKGLHTLLKAVENLTTAVRIDIAGSLTIDPGYSDRMQSAVKQMGPSFAATFHASLNNEPLIELLKQAHVLVVPSSYEGFGIAYLEGMCFGLPAIGTTAGGAAEIIEHDITGYLIDPGDHAGLSILIRELADNRSLLERLSLNARNYYQRQPSWQDTGKSIRGFLQTMITSYE